MLLLLQIFVLDHLGRFVPILSQDTLKSHTLQSKKKVSRTLQMMHSSSMFCTRGGCVWYEFWCLDSVVILHLLCKKQAESAIQNLALSSGHSSQQSMITAYVGEMLQILPHPKFWALRSLGALVYCRLLKSAFLLNADTLERYVNPPLQHKIQMV